MKKWIITAVIIGTVSVAITTWAMPQGAGQNRHSNRPGNRSGGGMEGGMGIGLLMHHPEIAEEAGITDEQVEQLRDLEYQNKRARIPLQSELSLAKLDMEHLIAQEEPDSPAIDKAIENVGRIQTELTKLQIQQRITVRKILGPESIEKIQEIIREKRTAHRENKSGKGRGRKSHGGKRGPQSFSQRENQPSVED